MRGGEKGYICIFTKKRRRGGGGGEITVTPKKAKTWLLNPKPPGPSHAS